MPTEREYPDGDVLDAVAADEPATAADVAESIGCSHRTATRRLRELADRGRLDRKMAGTAYVYMLSDGPSPGDSGDG